MLMMEAAALLVYISANLEIYIQCLSVSRRLIAFNTNKIASRLHACNENRDMGTLGEP